MKLLELVFVRTTQLLNKFGPVAQGMSRRVFVTGVSIASLSVVNADSARACCYGFGWCDNALLGQSSTTEQPHGPAAVAGTSWSDYRVVDGCPSGCEDCFDCGCPSGNNCWVGESCPGTCCDCYCYGPPVYGCIYYVGD